MLYRLESPEAAGIEEFGARLAALLERVNDRGDVVLDEAFVVRVCEIKDGLPQAGAFEMVFPVGTEAYFPPKVSSVGGGQPTTQVTPADRRCDGVVFLEPDSQTVIRHGATSYFFTVKPRRARTI